ncbi:MAG: glutamine-hydrolyzing carbamoyl-phosphate synthase small subunit [Thaumarchaeota archaeon]|nr:glutamine-hydrolyzing carbamoyl-phosphate synthase small subunit [Nitrososphaerota archaeon]
MKSEPNAALVLEDGTVFSGIGFGAAEKVSGEVVFNTGMVGYTEALTDPSYRGQILTFTYPLIGNYGVPPYGDPDQIPLSFESREIQTLGAIVHDLCEEPSHWSSSRNVARWFRDAGIPGITSIDTRTLTIKLRSEGVMMGILEVSENEIDIEGLRKESRTSKPYGNVDLVREVTPKSPRRYGSGDELVVLLDYGAKYGIIRNLLERNLSIVDLPYDSGVEEILSYHPSGVVISNGPGDPKACSATFPVIREIIDSNMPTLGICLGMQLIALALGGDTFKLRFGHRGQNKPCVEAPDGQSYVTSQNHGYAVDESSLGETGLKTWFLNADDKTLEGVRHKEKACIAVQFHPEASPGPYDTGFVFDRFIDMIRRPAT